MSALHEIETLSTAWPQPLRAALLRCARGEVSANVALAQIFMAVDDSSEARRALAEAAASCRHANSAEGARRLADAAALWQEHPSAFALVQSVLQVERGGADGHRRDVADWANVFDRLSAISPEAGVAIYSLGEPALLTAVTEEIAGWMRARGLARPGDAVLDLGCGSGRFVRALAPDVGSIVGLDVSSGMIGAARALCADIPNASLIVGSGRDLAPIADASIDLVYAIDAFPYLVEIGALAASHLRESARVLKKGGTLLILNYSYRGDLGRDRADIASLAAASGLKVLRNGTRDFALWDGLTFELQRGA